jgi:hypothetical protein
MISFSIMAICAAGPPKAKHPSLKKTVIISNTISNIYLFGILSTTATPR